jgi:hypothetical protein
MTQSEFSTSFYPDISMTCDRIKTSSFIRERKKSQEEKSSMHEKR